MTTHLNKILQERLKGNRYEFTQASSKLKASKYILEGKNLQGERVEIPAQDVAENPHIVAKKEGDKFYRHTSWDLAISHMEAPIAEGGLFRMPPPEVALRGQQALSNPLKAPLNIYPMDDVNSSYLDKAAQLFNEKMGIQCNAENMVLGHGVTDLVNGIISAITNGTSQERSVILGQKDEYHSYVRLADKWDAELKFVEPFSKNGLEKWWDENQTSQKNVDTLFFSNPVASTGYIYSQKELQGIADFAKEKDLFVVVDQIYGLSVYEPETKPLISFASLPDMAERTATLWGPSKDWGAPNLRQGFAAMPQEVAEVMYAHSQYSILTISKLQQEMGEALLDIALDENTHWLNETNTELKLRRDIIITKVDELNRDLAEKLAENNPDMFEKLNEHAKTRRITEAEKRYNGNDSALEAAKKNIDMSNHSHIAFIDIKSSPDAGHSVVIGFDDVVSFGMANRQGVKIDNNLEMTGLLMEHGLPTSPLYPSGNDSSQIRFSYSQFGDQATMVPYLRELMTIQAEWMNETFIQNITPDLSNEGVKKYAQAQGLDIAEKNLKINSYEEGYQVGRDIISRAMDRMGDALLELTTSQEKWQSRGQDQDLSNRWEEAIKRNALSTLTPLGRIY